MKGSAGFNDHSGASVLVGWFRFQFSRTIWFIKLFTKIWKIWKRRFNNDKFSSEFVTLLISNIHLFGIMFICYWNFLQNLYRFRNIIHVKGSGWNTGVKMKQRRPETETFRYLIHISDRVKEKSSKSFDKTVGQIKKTIFVYTQDE